MQPIFNEMIQMWRNLGITDLNLSEGAYWLDNGIVKAISTDKGKVINLYKFTIDENLNLSCKKHKDYNKLKNNTIETWKDTCDRLRAHLNKIERQSIGMLKNYTNIYKEYTVIDTNSTGKDSMVKTYLAQKAGLSFKTYFNVTTLDVKASTLFAREHGYEFIYPNIEKYGGFYQWVKNNNLIPSRLNRACCTFFKENPTIDNFHKSEKLLFLFGMRNSESTHRSSYTDEWNNEKWGSRDWKGVLPIRKWTDLDVWLYILRENIDINMKYRMGYSRVGCACACPNYSKSTWILDKYWYNSLYTRWRDILKDDFIKNNKWLIMNCTINEYVTNGWNGGVYRNEATEEVIKEYANHNELDYEIAQKYFNRYCENGCLNNRKQPKKIKSKEELGMNMKLYGRQIEKFKCKKCLMEELNITKQEWDNKVFDWKSQGCKLF